MVEIDVGSLRRSNGLKGSWVSTDILDRLLNVYQAAQTVERNIRLQLDIPVNDNYKWVTPNTIREWADILGQVHE